VEELNLKIENLEKELDESSSENEQMGIEMGLRLELEQKVGDLKTAVTEKIA